MPSYTVVSDSTGFLQTGVREPVQEWEDRGNGSRRPSDRQARDPETGMPLWAVEVIYPRTEYGRVTTVSAKVICASEEEPVGQPLTPVAFSNLVVNVYVNRAGALVEAWRADSLSVPALAGGRAPRVPAARVEGEAA